MTLAMATSGSASARPQIPNTTPSRIWNAKQRGRRDVECLTLEQWRQHIAFHGVDAEEQQKADSAATQPEARLASTTMTPAMMARRSG